MSNPSARETSSSSSQNQLEQLLRSAVTDLILSTGSLHTSPPSVGDDTTGAANAASALSRCARIIVTPVALPQHPPQSNSSPSVDDAMKAAFLSAASAFLRSFLLSSCATVSASNSKLDESEKRQPNVIVQGVIDALDCIRVSVRNPSRTEAISDPTFVNILFSALEVLSHSSPSPSSTSGSPEEQQGSERQRSTGQRSSLLDSLLKCMTNAAVQFPVFIRTFESPRYLNCLVEILASPITATVIGQCAKLMYFLAANSSTAAGVMLQRSSTGADKANESTNARTCLDVLGLTARFLAARPLHQDSVEGSLIWMFKLLYFLHNQLEARSASADDIKKEWLNGGSYAYVGQACDCVLRWNRPNSNPRGSLQCMASDGAFQCEGLAMQLLSVCPADLLPGVLGLGSEGEGEASSSGSSGSGSIDAAARLDRRLALLDHFQRQAWMAKNTLSPTLRRIDESASAASKSNSSSNSSSSSCSTLEVGGLTAAASARLDSPANLARLYPVLITLTHLVQSDLSSRRFYKALFLGTTSSAVGASGAAEAASPVSSQPVRIDRSAYSGLVDLVVAQMLQQLQDGGLKRYASELIFALCDENADEFVRQLGLGTAIWFLNIKGLFQIE